MQLPARPLHPKVRALWRAAAAIGACALAAPVLIVVVAARAPIWIPVAAFVVLVTAGWMIADAAYRRWRYEIRERDIFVVHGIVMLTVTLVPFDRIQYVETQEGPLDRMFGLQQLRVHTAGGSIAIPGLAPAEAGHLREELSRVAGTAGV